MCQEAAEQPSREQPGYASNLTSLQEQRHQSLDALEAVAVKEVTEEPPR
jgi:hypothetical protein